MSFLKFRALDDITKIQIISNMKLSRGLLTEALELKNRSHQQSAVLLSHISIMIAVTGVLWAFVEKSSVLNILLGIELIAYLVLAAICIFIQTDFGPMAFAEQSNSEGGSGYRLTEIERRTIDDSYLKWSCVSIVRKCLLFLTIALVLTIILVIPDADFAA